MPGSLTSTWSWKSRTCCEPISSPAIAARRRGADELLELRDPVPVAEVLEEAPGVVRAAGDERALARLGEVALDPRLDERDSRRENAPRTHTAPSRPKALDHGLSTTAHPTRAAPRGAEDLDAVTGLALELRDRLEVRGTR